MELLYFKKFSINGIWELFSCIWSILIYLHNVFRITNRSYIYHKSTFFNSCCKRCDENQCLAVHPAACTLSDESFCKNGHYFVKEEKESCGCCIPCAADDTCIAAGGYPERSGLDCRKGYSSVNSDDYCKCCVPGKYYFSSFMKRLTAPSPSPCLSIYIVIVI